MRTGELPNLGRKELDVEKMQLLRSQAREWDRTRRDATYTGEMSKFQVGDRVRYFDKGDWANVGEVFDTRTHGSNNTHSYYIKTEDGQILMRKNQKALGFKPVEEARGEMRTVEPF